MNSKMQQIFEQARASVEVTIELECFLSSDKARGLQDFSMFDIAIVQNKAPIGEKSEFVHGVIPLEWLTL